MARAAHDGPFHADLETHPVVRLSSPSVGTYDHVSIPSYFACVDLALAMARPFAVLHDVRDMPHVDETRRCEFMRLLDERRGPVERFLCGYAALVGSPLERGLVTAFAWFARVPAPVRLFTREHDALSWLGTRVDAKARARA